MCGRFSQNYSWTEIQRLANLIGEPRNLRPRYNIAPTSEIDVICALAEGRALRPMRWGLVPSWWKKPLNELPSTFNARAETIAEKPMFRSAFKTRRCVIPVSGFYEWTGEKGAKTPHYFSASCDEPLALAGLWEHWDDPVSGDELLSATIIVGEASDWMRRYHDRMPVILDWSNVGDWLTGANPGGLLRPAPDATLLEWIVSKRVNKAGAFDDDPTLVEPLFS
ncbi:MAG: SOS response-associated peptidase [Methylocystis sp.]|jgi:putative SOS response-associated peptidase YedK